MALFVLKHYPFKPLKLTELAYVRHLSGHNSFRDFPIQSVDAVCSVGPYVGLNFKAVIPKSLWGARLYKLSTRTFLQLLYLYFGIIQLWGELHCLSQVARCLLKFSVNHTMDHFFGIVTYCLWLHPILLKEKGHCLIGFTFQLHCK